MKGLGEMNDSRVAVIAALLAVSVALVFFVSAIVSGGTSGAEDAMQFKSNDTPEVRYVMNYEIDPSLYSFYQQQNEAAEALAASQASNDAAVQQAR